MKSRWNRLFAGPGRVTGLRKPAANSAVIKAKLRASVEDYMSRPSTRCDGEDANGEAWDRGAFAQRCTRGHSRVRRCRFVSRAISGQREGDTERRAVISNRPTQGTLPSVDIRKSLAGLASYRQNGTHGGCCPVERKLASEVSPADEAVRDGAGVSGLHIEVSP